MSHLLHLGYPEFIWPAYGATVIGIGAAIALTLRAYARAKAQLARLEKP